MYFLTDGYASFWGYGPLDPISSFATIGEGYSLVMLATFWACLLRKTDVWKAYGAASIVYFLATVDATFIRKYELVCCGVRCTPSTRRWRGTPYAVDVARHSPPAAPRRT